MEKMTDSQRKFLFAKMGEQGMTEEGIEKQLGIKISQLTKDSASFAIDALVNRKPVPRIEAPIDSSPPEKIPEKEKEKKEMVVSKASDRVSLMASLHGIPAPLANLFFMLIDDQLYVKSPGLLYMAKKQGYARISISSEEDGKGGFIASALVYPVIPVEVLKTFAALPHDVLEDIIDTHYGPTIGHGAANKENVKNTRMYPYLKELAETRAINRALRLYTGYGGTSYEEMPDSQIEVE